MTNAVSATLGQLIGWLEVPRQAKEAAGQARKDDNYRVYSAPKLIFYEDNGFNCGLRITCRVKAEITVGAIGPDIPVKKPPKPRFMQKH
ncbi:MAG: hypothetical protein WDN50_08700 [Bradyrhizobium sp.]